MYSICYSMNNDSINITVLKLDVDDYEKVQMKNRSCVSL